MPTTIRDGSVLQCKLGRRYSVAEEIHVPPSDGGDVMDDIDIMVLQMERMEQSALDAKLKPELSLPDEFSNSPPPNGESNELTEEDNQ